MHHMDDGKLQAWLDGERGGLTPEERAEIETALAENPDLAARVEELRADGAAVSDFLVALAAEEQGEAIPPFAEVMKRAGEAAGETTGESASGDGASGVHAGRRRFRPRMVTGWAASVMIALGAGWVWSEMSRTGGRAGVADQRVAGELAEVTDAAVRQSRPTVAERAGSTPLPPPAEAAEAEATDLPTEERAMRMALADEDVAPVALEVAERTDSTAVALAEDRVAAVGNNVAEALSAPAAAPAPAATAGLAAREADAVGAMADAPQLAEMERARRAALSLNADALVGEQLSWVEIPADTETTDGAPIHTVPGLDVVRVERADGWGVRVTQRLADGTEVFLWQPTGDDEGAGGAVAVAVPDGVGRAERVLEDGSVVIAVGAISTDALEAILARVR